MKAYQDAWPPEKRFAGPSLCAVNYYMKLRRRFRRSTKSTAISATATRNSATRSAHSYSTRRMGKIKLDENHQAIGTNFVTEVVKDKNGDLVSKVVKVVPNVRQRLGFSTRRPLTKFGLPGRESSGLSERLQLATSKFPVVPGRGRDLRRPRIARLVTGPDC